MKNSQRGFIVPLLIIIVVALAIGAGVYLCAKNRNQVSNQSTTTSLGIPQATENEGASPSPTSHSGQSSANNFSLPVVTWEPPATSTTAQITNINPSSTSIGSTVIINGNGLLGATGMYFYNPAVSPDIYYDLVGFTNSISAITDHSLSLVVPSQLQDYCPKDKQPCENLTEPIIFPGTYQIAVKDSLGNVSNLIPLTIFANSGLSLAQCLKNKGVVMYGASWAVNSQKTIALFGTAANEVPYVECSVPNTTNEAQACINQKITEYPTWIFPDGSRLQGLYTLQTLADKSGCNL